MTRSRLRHTSSGFSLFPFLAVLLCTVGVLIVMLVLMVHMARVDAAEEESHQGLIEPADPQRIAQEDYQWKRELLEQQRVKVQADMAQKRLELSHLEAHIRELERRWEELSESAADLKRRAGGQDAGRRASLAELERLEQEVRAAREELETARKHAAARPASYAIIPYEGPNATHRRPIYIECTDRGVTLQPEGIVLGPRDFDGPLGPGNPLDAALRSIREHYARAGAVGTQGEPYPLLIVRPGGIEAYVAAREAMRSWDDEFGYELVDDHMQLKYPDADPALADLLRKTVLDARSRQEILAAAMPSRFERSGDVGFVASPTRGGFVRQGGSVDRTPTGSRSGGFGQGGDDRFADGQAHGPVPGADTGAGPTADNAGAVPEHGLVQGVPGARIGGGVTPIARKRGRNWGLPQQMANATGIVRPIRVACLTDRLMILPDRGESRAPEVILIEGGMYEEVDALVSKLWQRVESWGVAVAGGYWKPVLHVSVMAGAEQRFEELRVLLDGSGLDIERSNR